MFESGTKMKKSYHRRRCPRPRRGTTSRAARRFDRDGSGAALRDTRWLPRPRPGARLLGDRTPGQREERQGCHDDSRCTCCFAMIPGGRRLRRQCPVTDPATLKTLAGYFCLATDIFLRLIKMIIGPLVFSTLVAGVAHMGAAGSSLWRIGLRTMAVHRRLVVSLLLGIVMVTALQPGAALGCCCPRPARPRACRLRRFEPQDFILHLVPKSFFEAMANNEILQIVVFSVFFGVALAAVGERAKPLLDGIDSLVLVMLKITGYVMLAALFAVFAALAATVATQGLGIPPPTASSSVALAVRCCCCGRS